MQSILNSVVNRLKSSTCVFATLALITTSFMIFAPKADALIHSVGTNTIVSLSAAPDEIILDSNVDSRFVIIYTTSTSSSYSIMAASQTPAAAVGGAEFGWSLTTLFSTTTNAGGNIAKIMDGGITASGAYVIYFYDAARGTLRVLNGAASAAPLAPVDVASVTVGGINVNLNNTHATVLFSSQTSDNSRFELVLASAALGSVTTALGANTVAVTSTSIDNVESEFDVVTTVDSSVTRVFYYDSISSSLKEVTLTSANLPIQSSRGTIDTGAASTIRATDAGTGTDAITRLVYTEGGTEVKYAVQKRGITNQVWYIQKIADGAAPFLFLTNNNDPRISFIAGGNLWQARGIKGKFFDDFGENIENAQLGKVNLVSNVSQGEIRQDTTGATRDRGVFIKSDSNDFGAINWLTISGGVNNTFGTALPGVSVSAVVTGSVTSISGLDLNPTDASNTNKEGGLTDGSGLYQIAVGSGASVVVDASSSPWVFLNASSQAGVNVTTITFGVDAANTSANLTAVSSPVFSAFAIDGLSAQTSTFSVAFIEVAANFVNNFTASALSNPLWHGFTRSANFRMVKQSAQGTAPTINVSTTSFETGSLNFDHAQVPTSRTAATLSTNTFFARYASTNTTLPSWFTIVMTTMTPAGHIMQGSLVDAVNLRPVELNFATATPLQTMPGLSVSISSSQINTAVQATFVVRSSFTNNLGTQFESVAPGNIYLTTSTTIPGGTLLSYTHDIPLYVNELDGNGSVFKATTVVLGADAANPYFVRVSSRPDNAHARNPLFAFSPAISISSPAITSVKIDRGSDSVISSTGSTVLHVEGRGFVASVGTVTFSTSTTINSGVPLVPAGSVTFSVNSSTSMDVTIAGVNANVVGGPFHLFYSTFHVGTGYVDGIGVAASTVVATSEEITASGAITVGTASVASITPSVVTNTRQHTLTIKGRGLLGGSTVTLLATDGSTATAVVAVAEAPGGALTQLTATVDFRSPIFAGKSFYAVVSSFPLLNTTVVLPSTSSIFSTTTVRTSALVTVSSMSVAVNYPALNGVGASVIYNSTTGFNTLGLSGAGLVGGTTVNFSAMGGFTSTITFASVNSSGTFGAFISSSFHNATAQTYTLNISTLVGLFGNLPKFSATASTTLVVANAAITAVTLASHANAINTLTQATYTVTGTGLLPHVSFYLRLGVDSDRIGETSRSLNANDYSSVNVEFDLRAATTTSAAWVLEGQSGGAVGGSTKTITSSALTISTIITLSVIPDPNPAVGNAGTASISINGAGLAQGATVEAQYFGTALTSLGTTNFVGNDVANATIRLGTVTLVAGAETQSSGTVNIDMLRAVPSTSWRLKLSTSFSPGRYGGAAPQRSGAGDVVAVAFRDVTTNNSNTSTFTVVESSAPNAPTGLTVLSSGVDSVTLRWVSPGDDHDREPLRAGSKFVIYYSSGESNRGQGCAACYPANAVKEVGGILTTSATNFIFSETWAQFLRNGERDAASTVVTGTGPTAGTNSLYIGTNTARGITVSTQVVTIESVTVRTSSNATGTTSNSTIEPGRLVDVTLSISAGSTAGNFWFIVRAMDEAGNLSPTSVHYTTASALIGASVSGTTDVIDPNTTTTLTSVDLGGGIATGGTIPPGALEGSDSITQTADTSPPAATTGVNLVGAAVDIVLASGKTEFLKAITLTFTLSGAALAAVSGVDPALVKVAFFNGSRWVIIQESSISGGVVTARVAHLTKFAVVIAVPTTNLTGATVYPNPFRPSVAAQLAQGITFDQIPANTDVKIYTLAGDLVRELKDTDADGVIAWDAKNLDGQNVASGVYFALLKGGGDEKTIKVAVQR